MSASVRASVSGARPAGAEPKSTATANRPMPIAFLNPLMLWGLLGVAAPLYVHLRQRQRARRVPFSTLRFLRASDRHSARRHKIVDFIALVTRCLIVAALALGLSKPVIRPPGAPTVAASATSTCWAIVLDDSYSMDIQSSGDSPFVASKNACSRLLDLTEPGDEIALILASGRQPPGLAEVSHNKYQIRLVLEALRPSLTAASVADGVERALRIFSESKRDAFELVVLTDLQRNNLEQIQRIDPARLSEKLAAIHVLDASLTDAPNATLTDLKVLRAGPYPGAPITYRASILNSMSEPGGGGAGAGPGRPRPIERQCSLVVNGQRVSRKNVTFEGAGQIEVAFDHVLMKSGEYVASVTVAGDGLEADNQRLAPCDVYENVSVLLLADPPVAGEPWDAGFFLELALTPQKIKGVMARSPLRVDRFTPEQAQRLDFSKYNAVFCANLRSMSPDTLGALRTFVRGGGRLVVFAGEFAATGQSRFYADNSLFGWKFESAWSMEEFGDDARVLEAPEGSHPVFRALMDDPAIDFRSVQAYRYVGVDATTLDENSNVVARLSDGSPFVIEKNAGRGSILCFTAPPVPGWTSLPTRPLFLPLVHELVKYSLGGGKTPAQVVQVGRPYDVALPRVNEQAPTQATLIDEQGIRQALKISPGARTLTAPALERPGPYEIELKYGGGAAVERVRVLANVDPFEGDLRRVDGKTLTSWLPEAGRWQFHRGGGELVTSIQRQRRGLSLAVWFMAAALALFMFESFLVNMLLPRRAADFERRVSAARAGRAAGKTTG